MSIWAQIGDDRVTSVPPDGRTALTVYADFSFANAPLPEGAQITFLIGKGSLPDFSSGEQNVAPEWTVEIVTGSITPVDGLELESVSGERGFEVVGVVENTVVRDANGNLSVKPVAKCSVVPLADALVTEFTIIAYSDFDKQGTVSRLQPEQMGLTVMTGEGVFLSVGERYDPVADEWESIAPMPTGRAGLFAEAVGGKVYAIGGFNGNFTGATEEFDPSSGEWAEKSPLPIERGFGSSVVHDDKIYVIGGYNFSPGRASDLLHVYDPSLDTWSELAPLPLPLSHSVAQVVGDEIFVLFGAVAFEDKGGQDEEPSRFNFGVFKYDILSDAWSIEDVDITAVATPVSGTLSAAAAAGDTFVAVSSESYGPNGIAKIGSEVVSYSSYDASNGFLNLDAPLVSAHSSGTSVTIISIPETRIAASSFADGTDIGVFNGLSYLGFTNSAPTQIKGAISFYDTSSKAFTQSVTTADLPRARAGDVTLTVGLDDRAYAMGGSAGKSDFLNEIEYYSITGGSFTGGLAEMTFSRYNLGAATTGGLIYALGGGGSGHPPGWLKMDVSVSPEQLRADGKQTAGISITAVDDSGDPPPDGTQFSAQGIIYVQLTEEEQAAAAAEAQAAASQAGVSVESSAGEAGLPPPAQKVSILPVLFSSREMSMTDGIAATVALARSEDPIVEVENLFQLAKAGEAATSTDQLRQDTSEQRNPVQQVGTSRTLYSAAVEITVIDDFYFGQTDTDGAIAGIQSRDLSSISDGFTFNPQTAQQGLSATVSWFSDITSIPDVEILTDDPVDSVEAKSILDDESEEIPFGSSPHYDAIVDGARKRAIEKPEPPLSPPTNIMVTASDNDENSSQNDAADAAEAANAVDGDATFPVFVTTFIVTDPISLAARRARTDVADLELISSETGGNSFSVVDSSFVDFVIGRINSSAPASIGSGRVLATKAFDGTLVSVRFDVEGVPGNPGAVPNAGTNSAEMRIFTSLDNYNFEDLGVVIPPNTTFSVSPLRVSYVRYEVVLRTQTFDSPILTSVSLNYVEDNVQFLFTSPIEIPGQLTELAAVVNHRLPSGGKAEIGLAHGESIMFDRDYGNENQPVVSERGTIVAVNRSFDAFIGDDADQSTREVLDTEDFLVYRARSGPWAQEAITRIFVNEQEVLPAEFAALPEEGLVAFRKRLSAEDKVGMEVQLPSEFRVGLKITNPSLQEAKFDEFAFMYGTTQDDDGIRINRPPTAVNLFVTPEPAPPGGPLEANYTFVDPDGDEEDSERTEINWFRNGVLVPEARGKKSFSDSDLIAARPDAAREQRISKGQEWFFSVRPSDGKAFGPLSISHKVVIANVPPAADNVRLESSNVDPDKFTSSDSVVAKFDFKDIDEGDSAANTIYTWFVNGAEIKSGGSNAIGPDETDSAGAKLLRPGNVVFAEIVPSDGSDFGTPERTSTITVEGTPPSVTNVSVLPAAPSSSSDLRLTYQLQDEDGGTDQSTIAWFRNGARVSELDNISIVSSILTAPAQKWHAVVTPNNGFAAGVAVQSNTVIIQF